jgi:hypothetical protein
MTNTVIDLRNEPKENVFDPMPVDSEFGSDEIDLKPPRYDEHMI